MATHRPLLLPAAVLLLAGCTTTHTIQRTDAEGLGRLNEALSGKRVSVVTVTERAEGKLLHVALDSTRWYEGPTLRAAPMSELRAVVYDTRERNALRGMAFGAGLGGLTLLAAYLDEGDDWESRLNRLSAPFIAGGFVTTFAVYGYLLSSPMEYRFVSGSSEVLPVEE